MTLGDRPPHYRSFLLRCWEERSPSLNDLAIWRFSLEDSRTGRRHGFAKLEALVTFLQQELAEDKDEAFGE